MPTEVLIAAFVTIVTAATPLAFAAIGELVVEKSGVLNLGVEGMMIVGAIAAFATAVTLDNPALAILAGAGAGMALSAIFAVLVLLFLANQVATGLALTIFGLGVSALFGQEFIGKDYAGLPTNLMGGLSEMPVIGPVLFGHDIMVYLSIALVILVAWFLKRSRAGLILRAVGENHDAAHSIGYPVVRVRFLAILFGGACAGLGGAYLSIVYTPLWAEGMTAGRGWISLALVVFAAWKPWRALFGAYLFGGISIIQLHIQGAGEALSLFGYAIDIPSEVLSMLPYLVTIVALVLMSMDRARLKLSAPASLGKVFHATA